MPQSVLSSRTWRTFASGIAAVGVAGLIAGAIGCDDGGEQAALDVLASSNAVRASGGGTGDDAIGHLQSVAGGSGTSPAVIQAQRSLGQVQLAKADAAAVELARLEADAGGTLFRIGRLSRKASTGVLLAANYQQLNPEQGIAQIAAVTANVRGDGNVAVFPVTPDSTIPTLAVVQQEVSRLDGEIAKTQAAIDAATQQRDAQLSQAGAAAAGLESQSGDARGATVGQIADLRGQAAVASRQISDLTSTLTRLQADRAAQDAVGAQLQTAVESMTAQGASLAQGWEALSATAAAQTDLARQMVDGDGDSVKSLTATLNEQLKAIDERRAELETLYESAVAQFAGAATKAGTLVQELNAAKLATQGRGYEVPAWDRQASLFAVDRMNMDKARAQHALASMHAGRAAWLANVARVATSVEGVSEQLNVAAADPFNAEKLKTDLTASVTAASEAYDTVLATLDGVNLSDESLSALKPARAMTRIVTLSDQAALADLAARAEVAPDVAKRADEYRESMRAAAQEARDANVPLPALPTSLGGTPPTTAPAADVTTETTETTPNDAPPTDAPPAEQTPPADGTTPTEPVPETPTEPAPGEPAPPAEPTPADPAAGEPTPPADPAPEP